MAINPSMFSSGSDEWRTPDPIFNYFNSIYGFTLDAAATDENARCTKYFTQSNSALTNDWEGRVWCNPPYSRNLCHKFLEKAYEEIILKRNAELAVFLITARTDTKLWHNFVFSHASEVIFLKGRLKFMDENGVLGSGGAPFPSAIVLYEQDSDTKPTRLGTLEANPSGPTTPINYWS